MSAFPLWQGETALEEALAAFYAGGVRTGLRLLAGERLEHPPLPAWGPDPVADAAPATASPSAAGGRSRDRSAKGNRAPAPPSSAVRKRVYRRPALRTVLVHNLADLAVIAADWGLLVSDADQRLLERTPRAALEIVYDRLRSPRSIVGASRQLAPPARRLLAFVVKRGGAVTAGEALEDWAGGSRRLLEWAVRDAVSLHLLFLQDDGRVHGHRYPPELVRRDDTVLFVPAAYARHVVAGGGEQVERHEGS